MTVAESLVRFLDPATGPATTLESAPYPSYWRRLIWHSTARLHSNLDSAEAKLKILDFASGGWSRDREESQCKAIVEAVERWAAHHYLRVAPATAALDSDPSSTGFAAMPAQLGEDRLICAAYCEALERWALSRLWDRGEFPVEEIHPVDPILIAVLPESHETTCFFVADLRPAAPELTGERRVSFALCLIRTNEGGVLPGAACALDRAAAVEHAACEARIHLNAFRKIDRDISLSDIIERRIRYFGQRPDGFDTVLRRLSISPNPPPVLAPAPAFNRRLPGPWEPEVLVRRVIVGQSRPFAEGGEDRFLI